MSLTATDKNNVVDFWSTISDKADDIGHQALARMLVVYPQTKTYFDHWRDLSPESEHVKRHGAVIMRGVAEAVTKINELPEGLMKLSELHAFSLRVDPTNFQVLSHNILVVLAILYPDDFTDEVHVAMDKFLAVVSRALSEKYR